MRRAEWPHLKIQIYHLPIGRVSLPARWPALNVACDEAINRCRGLVDRACTAHLYKYTRCCADSVRLYNAPGPLSALSVLLVSAWLAEG